MAPRLAAVEEAAEGVGRLDDGAVAADAGHRRERVHLLCARELARQRIDGQHGDLACRQLLHQLGVLRRPDEADQRAAFAQQGHFVGAGRAHLEDDVRAVKQVGGRGHDLGAGGAVGVVGEVRRVARATLHGDREAQLEQLLHHLGHGRNALLASRCLKRNAYEHVCLLVVVARQGRRRLAPRRRFLKLPQSSIGSHRPRSNASLEFAAHVPVPASHFL
jgi:hypothetical protein